MLRLVATFPFCLTLAVTVWVLGAVTGSLVTGPRPSLLAVVGVGAPMLTRGQVWTPLSSALFSSGLAGYLAVTVLLVACAPMERRLGSGRTVLVFAACQLLGAGVAQAVVRFGAHAGDAWAQRLAGLTVVGLSPGAIGLLLAGSAVLDPLWRTRLRVLVTATLVTTMLYAGDLADVIRMAAGLIGLALGAALFGRRAPAPRSGRPAGDRRMLVALVVATSALGPVSTLLAAHRFGPLSALNFLFLPSLDADDVLRWCSGVVAGGRHACRFAGTAFLVQGVGPLFQTLLPVLVLMILAEGLRRGRRSAYLGSIATNLALALIGAALSHRELADLVADDGGTPMPGSEFWITRLAPIILPLAIVVLLVANREHFDVRLPWRMHRSWVFATTGAALASAAAYLGIGWLARDQFRPRPSWGQLLESLPGRFAPAGYLGEGHGRFFPDGPVAIALYEWTGAVFWTVALLLTLAHFWRSRTADLPPDRTAASVILHRHGGPSSLAYMTLWRGNHYYFTPDGTTYLAYRVIAAVAVTTGDPIGPRPASALEGFVAHCAASGWTPCFFSVTARTADLLRYEGFRSLPVASDTALDPQALSFTGKRWQDVRSALNRARRDDVRAVWSAFGDLPHDLADQVVAIDRQWLAGKELPEMGFTLGGLAELDDPEVRCLLAVDADDRVTAVTSWLPGFRNDEIIGWTLDFMRRGPDAFPGTMEFLIATALTTFRDEDAEWVSLSGVPLAWPEGDGPVGTLGHTVEVLAGILEPVYRFRSLLAFKAKFDPAYRPLLMAYPDPAALPMVTNAVLRAYVPHLGSAQLARLVPRLLRPAAGRSRALAAHDSLV